MKSIFSEQLVSLLSKELKKEDSTITSMDARVENYFAVMLYRILTNNQKELAIKEITFQYHIKNAQSRRHVDFKFDFNDGSNLFLELKHFAKTTTGSRNDLNFYFGNSKSTSIKNDLEKFEKDQLKGQKCLLVIVSGEELNTLPVHLEKFPNWVVKQMTISNSFSIVSFSTKP
jgi:hypothetical protein